MQEKIAGRGVTVTMNGVVVDNINQLAFPAGSLKFEGATEHETMPPSSNVYLTFTFTCDQFDLAAELLRHWAKYFAMLRRRERKRWRRYQRQKRKQ